MSDDATPQDDQQAQMERVRAVKQAHQADLLAKAHVVGVGIGLRQRGGEHTDEIALVVMVTKKLPPDQLAAQDMIPAEIDGVPVDVQQVGALKAQDD